MKKMYLISFCDGNHNPIYWLNNEFLGISMSTIAESLFRLGQVNGAETLEFQEIALTGDDFPDEIWEPLFDFFQEIPRLDETDVCLIVNQEWQELYEKRVKGVM